MIVDWAWQLLAGIILIIRRNVAAVVFMNLADGTCIQGQISSTLVIRTLLTASTMKKRVV